jgi:hypothetical protein
MSNKLVIEIRNLLEKEIQKSLRKTGELDSYSLVKNFRNSHKADLLKAADDLVGLALRSMVSEIRKRKKHKLWSDEQRLLFEGLPGIRQSFPMKSSSGRTITKLLPSLTVRELEDWLHSDSQPKSRIQSNPELAALLNQILPFAENMDTSVEQALRALKAGKKPSKKLG